MSLLCRKEVSWQCSQRSGCNVCGLSSVVGLIESIVLRSQELDSSGLTEHEDACTHPLFYHRTTGESLRATFNHLLIEFSVVIIRVNETSYLLRQTLD